jgi:hypothetical protein
MSLKGLRPEGERLYGEIRPRMELRRTVDMAENRKWDKKLCRNKGKISRTR